VAYDLLWETEQIQETWGNASGFSYEDLVSNRLGSVLNVLGINKAAYLTNECDLRRKPQSEQVFWAMEARCTRSGPCHRDPIKVMHPVRTANPMGLSYLFHHRVHPQTDICPEERPRAVVGPSELLSGWGLSPWVQVISSRPGLPVFWL